MPVFKRDFSMYIFTRQALKFLILASATTTLAMAQPAPTPIKMAMIEGLSGPFANTGEAVFRNLIWAVERVNARGGVKLPALSITVESLGETLVESGVWAQPTRATPSSKSSSSSRARQPARCQPDCLPGACRCSAPPRRSRRARAGLRPDPVASRSTRRASAARTAPC